MNAPCGLGLVDADYRLIWINVYLADLLGLPPGEFVGGPKLQAFVSPASRIYLQTRLQLELAVGGRVEELALDLMREDGARLPIMINAVQDASAGPGFIRIAVSRAPVRRAYEAEVPRARQAAEAEREVARGIIAGFVRHSPVPLVMTDVDLRITGVSEAWEKTYGQTFKAVVGQRIDQREGHVRTPDASWTSIYERALAGESLRGDTPARSAYSDAWFKWAVIPWRDAAGEVGGLLMMNFDVSDLIRARDAAAAAAEAKTRFLANMSHELRTPLNSVLAPIELMMGHDLAPGARASLQIVERAGADLARVLTAILDFSELEAGTFEVNRAPIDLSVLCRTLMAGLARDLEGRPIVLNGPSGVPSRAVLGDEDAVRRILVQLLSNSAKFTEAGAISLDLVFEDDAVTFTASDTGCGFDEREFDSLLRPFHQRDSSTTRSHGGVGLGLALAQALAQAIGGELTARSAVGEGSRVSLRVPLEWGAEIVPPAPAEQDVDSNSLRVLAVDDNPSNLSVLAAILEVVGAQIDFATNGLEAVERAGEADFDVILMDVQMPVMDGLSAIRAIRTREGGLGRRTPIVVVSANVSRPEIVAALTAGADQVLGKPIGAAALIESIMKVLEPHGATA
ncbi:MAG: response regulator [Alphaproteobacteria bacterium]|nr:response regulator [Alphaproteobacteria bacterium]MBU2270912.1 response regulator [Alphaproteobacteria bacterium]MBU2418307.1 response regulator [Alphaproteobacteria bacterium]